MDVPQRQRFELAIPVVDPLISELMGTAGDGRVRGMNSQRHFERLMTRQQRRV